MAMVTRKITGPKKKRTKKENDLLKSAETLAKLGFDLSEIEGLDERLEIEEAKKEHPKHFRNLAKNREAEAEGALFYLSARESLTKAVGKTCRNKDCGHKFLTNYSSVGYCSNDCRRDDLQNNYGIKWIDKLAEEQWGIYEPPMVLSGPVVKIMIRLLEKMGYTITPSASAAESVVDDQPSDSGIEYQSSSQDALTEAAEDSDHYAAPDSDDAENKNDPPSAPIPVNRPTAPVPSFLNAPFL